MLKIISGGQTGADQAALDAAIHMGIPHGGWLPRGRKTEAGPLPQTYQLQELHSSSYRDRTRKNILESDGTLIVSFGRLTGGSALTEALAVRYNRPCLHLDLTLVDQAGAVTAVTKWVEEHRIDVLNVAGPRGSGDPRIYGAVFNLLTAMDWGPDEKR